MVKKSILNVSIMVNAFINNIYDSIKADDFYCNDGVMYPTKKIKDN